MYSLHDGKLYYDYGLKTQMGPIKQLGVLFDITDNQALLIMHGEIILLKQRLDAYLEIGFSVKLIELEINEKTCEAVNNMINCTNYVPDELKPIVFA